MMQLKESRVLGLIMLACLAVISSHCYLTELSPWAMSVFIVASGYFLGYEHYEDFDSGAGIKKAVGFTLGKFRKIYILYLICILIAVAPAVYFTLRGYGGFTYDPVKGILLNVLLLQAWSPDYMFTVNGVGWYFSVCLVLFLLFPVILRLVKLLRSRKKCIAAAVIAVAVQALVSAFAFRFMPGEYCKWFNVSLPLCRISDFTLGVIIAHIIKSFPRKKHSKLRADIIELFAIITAGVSILAYYNIAIWADFVWAGYALVYALPSFLLVLSFARGEGIISAVLGNRFFRRLGLMGAAVYLVHSLVISNLISLAARFGIPEGIQHVLVPVGSAVISFLAGWIWKTAYTKVTQRSLAKQ